MPGRSVRLVARLATARAVSFAATRDRLPAPTFLTGTPIRAVGTIDRDGSRAAAGPPAGSARAARLRRLAVGAPPRRGRGGRAGRPRGALRRRASHRLGFLRPGRGAARLAAGRSPGALPALRLPARGHGRRAVGGGPARGPGRLLHAGRGDGRWTAHDRGALPARRRAPARQRAELVEAGAALLVADEEFDGDRAAAGCRPVRRSRPGRHGRRGPLAGTACRRSGHGRPARGARRQGRRCPPRTASSG